ncbi:rod binding protein [Leptospira inadai serovar Lyme str. 10]|uniref:Rod binding protein n=2 Tax=Leptospira inadai serovar Lyme TaxID=293084 RepID=V6HES6_9LEPT|nr:rod-binding protein [Leptospira inadai]EQA37888.1 rod binding protein [Leptospira inadai serovar Lyme str. 10]PNV73570.1 cell division protein [Leptospira inadai serovar Lyme]
MIDQINNYSNRLNLTERPEVQRLLREEKELRKGQTFPELLREEFNDKLSGKVSSSEVRMPHNIKEEVTADPYRKRLYDASVEFESIFVKMVLKEMKATVHKSGLIDGGYAEEIFEDMLYDEYSKNLSANSSLGLAEQIYQSLSLNLSPIKKLDSKI